MNKIKVVHFVTALKFGGAESVIYNLCKDMDSNIFEFHIVTQDNNDKANIETFRNIGMKIHIIPHKRKGLLKNIVNSYKIIKKEKFDIVHSHMNLSNFFALLPAMFAGTKVRISHSHTNFIPNNIIKRIAIHFLKILNDICTTERIACGDNAANFLFLKKYIKKEKVLILKNGIDTKKFIFNESIRNKIRKELKLKNEFLIGHVGRFVEVKNHDFIIEFFNEIIKEDKNYKLLLVGDGELKKSIENKVKELNLTKYVIFTGSTNNVNEFYQAMDLFVLPSKYEGMPVSLIEAQYSGLKCVVSNDISTQIDITKNISRLKNNNSYNWSQKILKIDKLIKERRVNILNDEYDAKIQSEILEKKYKMLGAVK